ncbi:hypothetical protein [Paracraurococcus ruber]|uniref:Uncharacterized protein n=1 Tax=Paracraurococcus ruber TaxID=77675 RepID=A0ABS1CYH7_9PROT|nr:hypothetical protein [Paracraurococcus ruber]MBK1659485.1 hypothetical protein [Paracraurococcus ruber]TDG33642.1 hypothetical protein E2C05_03035 [Paracraurococcus ruber]
MALTGDEIRDFYARCAAARLRLQDLAVRATPKEKVLDQMRRLGLTLDQEMGQVSDEELAFAFDLAIHTAPPGRSRAIDRVAKQHARLPGEGALVLNALTHAWVSIFRVLDRHPEEGLILEDALLGGEVWLVDQNIAETAPPGTVIASRIGRVAGFCISCGVVAHLDESRLAGVRGTLERSGLPAADLLADPRFAAMMWQDGLGFRIA